MFITSQKNRNCEKTVLKNIVLCLTIAKDSTWFMILQIDVEDLISFSEVSEERSVLRGKQLLSAMNTQWKLEWKCRTACFISQLFEKVLRGLIIFSVLILLLIYIKTLLGKKVSWSYNITPIINLHQDFRDSKSLVAFVCYLWSIVDTLILAQISKVTPVN